MWRCALSHRSLRESKGVRTPLPRRKQAAGDFTVGHASQLSDCFTLALAQQGARANAYGRHVSCCRRSRASHRRGSALTLGKERFPMKITAGLKAAAKALVADPKAESFRASGKLIE